LVTTVINLGQNAELILASSGRLASFSAIDFLPKIAYPNTMERHVRSGENSRTYYTAPWRKARICARLVLRPELTQRERYARLAAALTQDPSVTNRLVGQAIAHFQGKNYRRHLAA
jgi:hypothetical protein